MAYNKQAGENSGTAEYERKKEAFPFSMPSLFNVKQHNVKINI